MAEHGRQAHPRVTQLGGRRASSPPCTLEQGVEIARYSPFQHVIDGPGLLRGQHRSRLALAVFFL
jgi:hypothetical protein